MILSIFEIFIRYNIMTTKEQIKNTGATFTPKDLAKFLANRISQYIVGSNLNVLDPACGEGELLIAIGQVLTETNKDFRLCGYDANAEYLSYAKERMLEFPSDKIELIQGDFLEAIDTTNDQISLNLFKQPPSSVNSSFDVVIANPPYVRTQILGAEQAQILARKFNLKGRVDLYYPFLIAMTESLKKGGIVGVITSNRYLSTKSGESVRKFLSENYEILELIDLGDTKLFDAAVLPAIFIGKKRKQITPAFAKFTKVYEDLNVLNENYTFASDVYNMLASDKAGYFISGNKQYKKTSGQLKYSIGTTESWEMLSCDESDWVTQIDKNSKGRIGDTFKVRVGIKSTADKIFISDKWDKLGFDMPEGELLKELLSQENIQPWNATENLKLKVLYPHVSVNGEKQTVKIKDYPKAEKYFLKHQERLKSRKYLLDAGRQWYELWVSHRPDQWLFPKLVFPDISLKPRFYFDTEGRIVNGNCYWIVATNVEDIQKLLLIQGIANSRLMTKYHDLVFNNKLYSGRRRYFTQYVEKYPLPDFDSSISKEIISIVKQLNQSVNNMETLKLESLLEVLVASAFSVEPVLNLD